MSIIASIIARSLIIINIMQSFLRWIWRCFCNKLGICVFKNYHFLIIPSRGAELLIIRPYWIF